MTSRGLFQAVLFYDSMEGSHIYSETFPCKASIWPCVIIGLHRPHREHQPLLCYIWQVKREELQCVCQTMCPYHILQVTLEGLETVKDNVSALRTHLLRNAVSGLFWGKQHMVELY